MSQPTSRARASRAKARHTESASTERPFARFVRRVPWVAVGITLLALISAAFAIDPIRDAVTLGTVPEARLDLPPAYVAIAPLSNVLDTLTLLSVPQHIAVMLWAILLFALWRVVRARRRTTSIVSEVVAAVGLLAGIFVVYALVAFMPRPMARLATTQDDVLAIDFHSHTQYSHDGRRGWTEEDVRNWHRAAGYDVAYITDHATFQGAERGIAGNPRFAGQGTMLLQGIEANYKGEHINILSAGRLYQGLLTKDLKNVDEQALAIASFLPTAGPVLIETVPGNLNKVPGAGGVGQPGVQAIELIDGSPRGLVQTRSGNARILYLADSMTLGLVTGSDNHGYGRTAPGWTLMRIEGWRGMNTDSLAAHIEASLRVGRERATRVVVRRVATGTTAAGIVFAAPAIVWRMFTMLSPDERVLWILWTWLIVVIARGLRAYRLRPSRTNSELEARSAR